MNPRRADELKLAFMLLTRLPVTPIPGEPPAMSASSWAWPIVGLIVGLVSAVACRVAMGFDLPPLMVAIVALAVGALVTGAMHEDGLADVADGFGGGRTVERKLEIMRDSRIGSYGVVALVLSLGFRAAGISAVAGSGTTLFALVAVAAASRAVLPTALLFMPPSRADGLGRSAAEVDPVPALMAVAIGIFCLLPLGLGATVGIAFAMALTTLAVALLALRQIGGQTGDVLGAMQQAAECAGWACLAASV